MNVISLPSLPSTVGSSANFTNQTHVVPVLQTGGPTNLAVTRRLTVRSLTFDRSARTHWHSHPLGQLLIVTHGSGLIQQRGQPVQPVSDGDVVWAPANVDHWHGGSTDHTTTHIAVHQQAHTGATVQWKEAVDDGTYNASPQSTTQSTAASADQSTVQVIHIAALPTTSEHNAHFTGTVHLTPLLTSLTPTHTVAMSVTFECCARSDWHSHPLGQLLIVTHGSGRIQQRGQPVRRLTPGDIVWTPPAVEHWHGADKVGTMTHVAVVWGLDGKIVDWKEPVGDAEYNAEPELASGERLE